MGLYINPSNESKEDFLKREGTTAPLGLKWQDIPSDQTAVVLIFNPMFTAAGVCYCEGELKAFTHPSDMRPRIVYLVPTAKVIEVCLEYTEYVEK